MITATAKHRSVRDGDGDEVWTGIVSRFQLVLLAGRRSKQLLYDAHPQISADPVKRRNTSIALEELRQGLVPFQSPKANESQTIPTAIDTVGNTAVVEAPDCFSLPLFALNSRRPLPAQQQHCL